MEKEYAPSIYAPSVHESEGVAAIIGSLTGNEAGSGSGYSPSPAVRGKELPAVPGGDSASASGSRGGMSTPPTGSSRPLEGETPTRDLARGEIAIHSDGGSTPRGSSEDLRAAQRGMGEGAGRSEPMAIAVPRTPDRERDILNS